MTAHNNSYPRTEKLKSRKLIQQLFAEGKSVTVAPVKCFYLLQPPGITESIQAGVGVSARNFKKAVHRNRIKRLLREAYRLNNHSLHQVLAKNEKQVAIFILYTGKELPAFHALQKTVQGVLEKLQKVVE